MGELPLEIVERPSTLAGLESASSWEWSLFGNVIRAGGTGSGRYRLPKELGLSVQCNCEDYGEAVQRLLRHSFNQVFSHSA